MTRIKRGYIARRRRTKIRLFASSFRGAHSRLTRTITQQKIRALVSAHRDRDKQKRNFRRLWITRINAVIREKGVSYSYSNLIHDLYKRQLLLNRKYDAKLYSSHNHSNWAHQQYIQTTGKFSLYAPAMALRTLNPLTVKVTTQASTPRDRRFM